MSNTCLSKPRAQETLVSLSAPSAGGFHVRLRTAVVSDTLILAPAENRTNHQSICEIMDSRTKAAKK